MPLPPLRHFRYDIAARFSPFIIFTLIAAAAAFVYADAAMLRRRDDGASAAISCADAACPRYAAYASSAPRFRTIHSSRHDTRDAAAARRMMPRALPTRNAQRSAAPACAAWRRAHDIAMPPLPLPLMAAPCRALCRRA
jgi:hypothetical protein